MSEIIRVEVHTGYVSNDIMNQVVGGEGQFNKWVSLDDYNKVVNAFKKELSEKDKRIKELEGIIKDNADGIEMLDERQCEIFNEIV